MIDKCRACKEWFDVDDIIYGPDPFKEEIHGDTTPTVLCSICYRAKADDV